MLLNACAGGLAVEDVTSTAFLSLIIIRYLEQMKTNIFLNARVVLFNHHANAHTHMTSLASTHNQKYWLVRVVVGVVCIFELVRS